MGMFDNVKCEYPLPDQPEGGEFQTKSFGDDFVGGFMDDYTITKDGELIFHKRSWDYVEEEDRPYYGKPEWDENPMFRMVGCLSSVPLGDEVMNHHGIINMYTEINGTWYEYDVKFTDGKVSDVKRIYREFGNG